MGLVGFVVQTIMAWGGQNVSLRPISFSAPINNSIWLDLGRNEMGDETTKECRASVVGASESGVVSPSDFHFHSGRQPK